MKSRDGFVTNSSSSSFIVCFRLEIPDGFASYLTAITKETLDEYIVETKYLDMDEDLFGKTDEELKKILNIDDNALFFVKLANASSYSSAFEDYLTLKEHFEKYPNDVLYELSYEWGHEPRELFSYLTDDDVILRLD